MDKQPQVDEDLLKQAIAFHGYALVSILQQIQGHYGYLPEAVLRALSRESGISLVDIYRAATFYSSFSLKPRGRHQIVLCSGTTCHACGSAQILAEVSSLLGISPGEVTDDGEFSMETVNCLGYCAFAPVMVVDGKHYGRMNPAKAREIIVSLQEKTGRVAVQAR